MLKPLTRAREKSTTPLPLSEAICKYWVAWQHMNWPLDWDHLFGRSAPLVVEIGFGNGQFLVDLAQAHPDRNFVGIERAWSSIVHLFRRLETSGIENVRVLESDAGFAVRQLFGPASLQDLFINFPDPWHKERHHGRRLINGPFIERVGERLIPGGMVTLATDQADYAEWITEALEGQSALKSKHTSTWLDFLPGRKPTKYEEKALRSGVPIRYFEWQQMNQVKVNRVVEKVGEMPNVILDGEFDATKILVDGQQMVWKETEKNVHAVVKLMDVYSHLNDGHRLVSMMVQEGELVQYFGISVVFRDDNILVKLASIGQPRATWGVKWAVLKIADRVMRDAPGLRVKSSTIDI
jgi:tRNA (guanine-N7-)-methyltransferase